MASLSSTNTRLQPPSWPSDTSSNSFREASFSSYLNTSEEAYIRSLVDNPLHPNSRPPKKVEDGEIDVFSADKYFGNGMNQERNNSTKSSKNNAKFQEYLEHNTEVPTTQPVVTKLVNPNKLKFQSRTPSNQSEQSSNSQSALLKRFHRNPSKSSENISKTQQTGKISLLSCSCCIRKSVDIDRDRDRDQFNKQVSRSGMSDKPLGYSKAFTRSIKTDLDTAEITRINKLRLDHNTEPLVFPVSDCAGINIIDAKEDESRKSVDVFGSSDLDDGSKRFSLQKRLNMLSWDAIPRATTEEINTSGAPSETYKDTESDASSDLFEIECLSCTANPVIQGPRVPSDGSSTPTTGYAPSEASIEWSVVTASAADFSTASDYEEQRPSVLPLGTRLKLASKKSSPVKMTTNKEVHQKPVSGILLGCKSQKAVNVAREVHRRTPTRGKSESQRMQRLSDSFAPVTRFQAEAKLAGFSHRQRQKSLSLDVLYIQ